MITSQTPCFAALGKWRPVFIQSTLKLQVKCRRGTVCDFVDNASLLKSKRNKNRWAPVVIHNHFSNKEFKKIIHNL